MITIFTPTYNRAYCLETLYASLKRQTNQNFEFLVIDDCSTDQTHEILLSMKEDTERKFPLVIHTNEKNEGLMRNINKSWGLSSSEWVFKLDSDDYLVDDAVENLIKWISTIENNPMCVGVGGFRQKPNGDLLLQNGCKPDFNSEGYIDVKFFDRNLHNLNVDTMEAYRKSIRENYSIPVWEGEKDGPERVAFFNMANDGYFIRWFDKPLSVSEYLEDGMTLNPEEIKKKNPMSMAICFNWYSSYKYYSLKERIRFSSEFVYYSIVGKNKIYILSAKSKLIVLIGFPLGAIKYIKREIIQRGKRKNA